ncbi:hypothetical protein TRVA0_005S02696 [Trichomonascus vanleenenianus]|uniref:uncharacterized protein n=1 Tax=Trichomonascus vanleenenianus TaxID=2268995 RepID=UPI003EC98D1F
MPRPTRSRRRLAEARDVSTIVEANEMSSSPLSSPASVEMGRRAFPSSPIKGDVAEEDDPFGFSAFAKPLDPPRGKPSTYAQKALDDFPIYLEEERRGDEYYVQDEGRSEDADKENEKSAGPSSSRFVTPLTQSPTSSCKSPHRTKKHEMMSPEELEEPRKRQPLKQLTGMELMEKMPRHSVEELMEEVEEEDEAESDDEDSDSDFARPQKRRQPSKKRRRREQSVGSVGSTPSPVSKKIKAKFADVDEYQLQEEKFSSSPY